MKNLSVALITFLFPILGFCDTLEEQYVALCKYDSQCPLLKSGFLRKEFIRPAEALLSFFATSKDQVIEIANKFDIDPRALVGAVLAEKSLNTQFSDHVQDYVIENNIGDSQGTGSLFGLKFSYGFAQIYEDAAQDAEALAASVMGRPKHSQRKRAKALLDPGESMVYAAAIMRRAQDKYAAEGMDIKNKPHLLATLFNVGKIETRIAYAKSNGNTPRENYFGFFVRQNIPLIEKTLGLDANTAAFSPSQGYNLTQTLSVFQGVPRCSGAESTISLKDVELKGDYKGKLVIIDEALDCNMKPYVLMKFEDGKYAWTRKDTFLREAKTTVLSEAQKCKTPKDSTCEKSFLAANKKGLSSVDGANAKYELRDLANTKNSFYSINCVEPKEFDGAQYETISQSKAMELAKRGKDLFQKICQKIPRRCKNDNLRFYWIFDLYRCGETCKIAKEFETYLDEDEANMADDNSYRPRDLTPFEPVKKDSKISRTLNYTHDVDRCTSSRSDLIAIRNMKSVLGRRELEKLDSDDVAEKVDYMHALCKLKQAALGGYSETNIKCYSCKPTSPENLNIQVFPDQDIAKILSTLKTSTDATDFKDVLQKAYDNEMKSLNEKYISKLLPPFECGASPLALFDSAGNSKMASSTCVRKIGVPNLWMIQMLPVEQRSKYIHRPNMEGNAYSVDFETACAGTATSGGTADGTTTIPENK